MHCISLSDQVGFMTQPPLSTPFQSPRVCFSPPTPRRSLDKNPSSASNGTPSNRSPSVDGSAIPELRRALNEYLSVLIGLTKKEYGLEGLREFKWKNFNDGRQDNIIANVWFEVLSAVHFMAMLALSEADSMMIPKDHLGSRFRVVSSDNSRKAIDLLLKASGYLEFCLRNILARIPAETKNENLTPRLAARCFGGYSYSSTGPRI